MTDTNKDEEIIWESQTISKEQMLDRIYEVIADKQLSLGCVLEFNEKDMDNKYWPIVLFKYVRQWSSSSEWYDWYRTQRWDLVCANMRQWEFKFITKRYRNCMHRQPDEEGERICDELVEKYFTIIWHPVMIGDVLDWIKKNIETTYGTCPECWWEVWYDEWQEASHSGTWSLWDWPPSYYCINSKWDHKVDSFVNPTWPREPIRTLLWEDYWEITPWIYKREETRKPIDEQSEECIKFIYWPLPSA